MKSALPKGTQRVAKMIVAKHDVEFAPTRHFHQLLLATGR